MVVTAAQILAAADENAPRNWPGRKPADEQLLTTIRAARMVGVSAVTLARMNRDGLIPRVRVRTTYYFRLADVLAYLGRDAA